MTLAILAAYAAALLLAAATPGPAMFAVISTGLSRGWRPAAAVGLGVAIGDVLLVSLAMLGLAALAAAFGWVFAVVKYAGAAYLIWLGIRMWRASAAVQEGTRPAAGHPLRALGLGAAIAFGNPKAILFHASLMPILIDVAALTLRDAAVVMAIVFAVNIVTMGVYALLAGGASGWFRTPGRLRLLNRLAGGAMVGTGAVIAAR